MMDRAPRRRSMMAENTNIEWTEHSFVPWKGCQKVGPGCDHCYAESLDLRWGGEVHWGPHAARERTTPKVWNKPLDWDRKAKALGERHRVFCSSLSDVFDTHASIAREWRSDLARLIEATPNLDWLLLTKRAGNVEPVLGRMFPDGVPSNVCVGLTVVNQAEADRDIVKLLLAKARLRIGMVFLSMEPLLGPVKLTEVDPEVFQEDGSHPEMDPDCDAAVEAWNVLDGIRYSWGRRHDGGRNDEGGTLKLAVDGGPRVWVDWVIVGGESGDQARVMHPDWVRMLRDQCAAHGTPFLFKQWGEWAPIDEPEEGAVVVLMDGRVVPVAEHVAMVERGDPMASTGVLMGRPGKKAAGRTLDGRTHDGKPDRYLTALVA